MTHFFIPQMGYFRDRELQYGMLYGIIQQATGCQAKGCLNEQAALLAGTVGS
jgi:hypothetical protein